MTKLVLIIPKEKELHCLQYVGKVHTHTAILDLEAAVDAEEMMYHIENFRQMD